MKKIMVLIMVAGSVGLCQAQTVTLSSLNEPGNPNFDTEIYSTAASAQYSLTGSTLTISSGSFMNLWGSPIQVAVWDGTAGTVGTELFAISETVSSGSGNLYAGTFGGSGSLTTQQITDYGNDDLYVNITTTSQGSPSGGNANGEVRGQLTTVVPEPATMTLMALGSAAWLAKRRKKS